MATLIAIDFVSDFSLYNSSNADLIIVNDDARTSGNTFQWQSTGTANGGTVYAGSTGFWHMMFTGHANVKWYGAKGDGITDDSAAIQATLDNHGSIYFPASATPYRCNVLARGQSIFGDKTVKIDNVFFRSTLQSYQEDGYALHLGAHESWDYVPVNDIWITGRDLDNNIIGNGVQFDNGGENDNLGGRWVFNSVTFVDCIVAVNKPYGNIGNTFNSCSFSGGNYHYHALSDPGMHTGCDTFNSCQFDSAACSSIYINQGAMPVGQHTFNECIFEANPGFAFFIAQYSFVSSTTFRIENCWFEANAYAESVTIDGDSYSPSEIYFSGLSPALITGTTVNSIHSIGSEVFFENCQMGELTAERSLLHFINSKVGAYAWNIDGDTVIYGQGGRVNGNNSFPVIYDHPPQNFEGSTPGGFWIRMKPRTHISNRYSDNIIVADAMNSADSYPFTGTYYNAANRVKDGTSSRVCAELTINAGQANVYSYSLFTLPATAVDKYLVWTYDLKRISGTVPEIGLRDIISYAGDIMLDIPIGEWTTVCGCAKVSTYYSTNTAGLLVYNPDPSNPLTVRIGGFSILLLDTEQEAVEALASGELFVKKADQVVFDGTQSPASASVAATWNVGDRCVNTAPSTGNPKGWICTVAGTPGTWVSEGNL